MYVQKFLKRESRSYLLLSLFVLLLFPASVYSQAAKATEGTGLYKERIFWINWDLNGDGEYGDQIISQTQRTFTSDSGISYTFKVSNVTGNVKSGSPYDWNGNNFPYGYGKIGGDEEGAGNIIAIATGDNGQAISLRLTATVDYPNGPSGNPKAFVFAGTESLSSTSQEHYSLSVPQGVGTIRYLDKVVLDNNWSNISLTLDRTTVNGMDRVFVNNPSGSDSRGDVLLYVENVGSIDVEAKGSGLQHIAVGVMEDVDFSDAPDSYGKAVHLINSNAVGGVVGTGITNINNQPNDQDNTRLQFGTPLLRIGNDVTSDHGYAPSAAADSDDDDGLVSNIISFPEKLRLKVNNGGSIAAKLYVWVDGNKNGSFGDSGEFKEFPVPAGFNNEIEIDIRDIPGVKAGDEYFVRFRLTTDVLTAADFATFATDGEVEDWLVKVRPRYWVGGIDNEWNDERNWSTPEVPVTGDDVEFATLDNNPVEPGNPRSGPAQRDLHVPVSDPKLIGKLINESDKALVVPPGSVITVTDDIVGYKTPGDAYKLVIQADDNPTDGLTPNGSFIATDMCEEDDPANIVYGTVELFAQGREWPEGQWEDNLPGSPTIDKDLFSSYSWQHFGVPAAGLNAFPTFYESWIKKYDETRNGSILSDGTKTFYDKWAYVGSHDELIMFDGYEITQKAPKIYTIQGKLFFCDKELTLTRRAEFVPPKAGDSDGVNQHYGLGQNVFGNSYTAAINLENGILFDDEVEPDGQSQIEKTVYLYRTGTFTEWGNNNDPVTNAQPNAGSYLAIPAKVSTVVWDNQIPSLQGFLLRFTDAETDFGEPDRKVKLVYGNDGVVGNKRPQLTSEAALSYLSVTLMSASTVDKVWLFSQPGTSDAFDNGWDGFKFFGTPTAFIYSESPEGPMQVNTSSKLDGKVLTIVPNNDKLYTLKLNKSNLEEYSDLHLLDLLTGQMVPLSSEETVYNFTATHAGERVKRFVIVNSSDVDPASIGRLDGYLHSNSELVLSNLTTQNGRFYLYDIAGKQMMSSKLLQGVNRINVQLTPGIYMLNMETAGERERVKLIVK